LKRYNKITSANNNAEVFFMNKKDKKKKKVIDLRRFMEPEMMNVDSTGSYTGLTEDMLFDGDMDDEPIQDADDL